MADPASNIVAVGAAGTRIQPSGGVILHPMACACCGKYTIANCLTSGKAENPGFLDRLVLAVLTVLRGTSPEHIAERANQLRAEAEDLYLRVLELRRRADHIETAKADRARLDERRRMIRHAALAAERGATDATILGRIRPYVNNDGEARAWLAAERMTVKRVARATRNRLIMQLAAKGWTNKKIGDDRRNRLAEKTVSRIVAPPTPQGRMEMRAVAVAVLLAMTGTPPPPLTTGGPSAASFYRDCGTYLRGMFQLGAAPLLWRATWTCCGKARNSVSAISRLTTRF